VDSYNAAGEHDADKIIDFVKMAAPSFGAVNLEDISQPNCFKVLDVLRESCQIPVWHDDAQGTACITLAGLINALKLADKDISKVRIAFLERELRIPAFSASSCRRAETRKHDRDRHQGRLAQGPGRHQGRQAFL